MPTTYETYINSDGPPRLDEPTLAGGGIWDILGSGFDLLSGSQKGRILTGGIVASGLARDPAALLAHFNANKAAIDGYVNQINTGKLVRMAATPQQGPSPLLTFLAGVAIGGGIVYYLAHE